MDANQARLFDALDGIKGWLDPSEAWALHETARRAGSSGSTPTVVEVGSFHGRSTISLAYGLQSGCGGRLYAIDPHRNPENLGHFLRNVKAAGCGNQIIQMCTFSHKAVTAFDPQTVDVLFLDGAHDYGSVFQDIKNWSPKLADGAVIALNDAVWWDGVRRAIQDTIARPGSGFRNPRWVFNTIFFDYRPTARWTPVDGVRLVRLKMFLLFAGVWSRINKRVEQRTELRTFPARVAARLVRLSLRTVLPAA